MDYFVVHIGVAGVYTAGCMQLISGSPGTTNKSCVVSVLGNSDSVFVVKLCTIICAAGSMNKHSFPSCATTSKIVRVPAIWVNELASMLLTRCQSVDLFVSVG